MSKCKLSIELPGPDDFVPPGGELDVIVHVSCDRTMKCNGLHLGRSWRTHGLGNRPDGGSLVEELFSGTWEPGDYAYPTKVRFPEGPRSYHGLAINVDWYLEARADIPIGIDPTAERMVLMVDPAPPKPYTPPRVWAPQPIKLSTSASPWMIVAFMMIPVIFVLMLAFTPTLGLLLIPVVAYLILSFRSGNATVRSIGQVALELHPQTIAPGEELHAMLRLQPRKSVDIEHVTMNLRAMESTTNGSGTTSTYHREEAFLLEERVAGDLQLSGGDHLEEECTFKLPITAPESLDLRDNEITTRFKLEIQIVGQEIVAFDQPIHIGPTLRFD